MGRMEVGESLYRERERAEGEEAESTRGSRWCGQRGCLHLSFLIYILLFFFIFLFNSFRLHNTHQYQDARADMIFGFMQCIWWNRFWNIERRMVWVC